jgi:protein ImuA
VDKAARPPLSPQSLTTRIFAVRSDADSSASKRMRSLIPGGGAVAPSFAPPSAPPPPQGAVIQAPQGAVIQAPQGAEPPSPRRGQAELARLRAALAAIEGGAPGIDPEHDALENNRGSGWTLGASEIDGWLPERRLDAASLTEIKPETYGDGPAALTFALLLAARRMSASSAGHAGRPRRAGRVAGTPIPNLPAPCLPTQRLIVWCWPTRMAREAGGLYGPGLATLGIDPVQVLLVEGANTAETLWAMEESLGSGAAAIVVGCVDAVALTPARRLALAAQAHRTPGLLVTAARSAVTPATFARWRIAGCPSAPHPFDPVAPGAARFAMTLERCRGTAADVAPLFRTVEWSHETYRFGVVAGVADRAPEAASRA